jgi:uncharacterized protein (DUF1501 family)
MRTLWEEELTRRAVLKFGIASAAALTLPWPLRRPAQAQATSPHFTVVLQADGGWDPTQVFDPHDPNDSTDGIDVDVPGSPASVITSVGGITYVSNPLTRPSVDTFFQNWASRSAVVNGISTRSTSHSQSTQLVLTGFLDPTRADFAVMSAHHNGSDLPLPHLHLSGDSFGGAFGGLSGRLGGQMSSVINYNRIEDDQLGVSGLGEAYVQQALEFERLLNHDAPPSAIAGRLADFDDGNARGDMLAQLATSLNINGNDGTQLATTLGSAFRSGLTTSVTASRFGGFDTHGDNNVQSPRFETVFTFMNDFLIGLQNEAGVARPSLLDETTVILCSEFGRTPRLNGTGGKDHHSWTSMLLAGKRVRGGQTFGLTDRDQEGVTVNFSTGQPDNAGQVIDVTNMVAGLLTVMGANANTYIPGVEPFTAVVGA